MTDRATRERLSLLRAAQALVQVRDLQTLLDRILDETTRVIGADRSSLFLVDAEKNELVSRIAQRSEVKEIRLPFGKGLAGHVAKTGTAVVVDNAYDDPRFTSETDRSTGYRTRTVACAPMQAGDGRIIGVIEVMNKHDGPFDADDMKLLTAFGHFSAVAIEKTRLFEENVRKTAEIAELNRQLRESLTLQSRKLAQAEKELTDSKRQLAGKHSHRNIVGRSAAMQQLYKTIDRVAASKEPVLICGESGTGKELVARAIHFGSPRAGNTFVSENCAAVADTLLEAELFGHRKGAFTGADRDRVGVFETASGGTLFLDEVGDMSLDMQKKILRTLQEGEVRAVGAREPRKVDVRVVAATNRDLEKMVKEKAFREDLFYRLNVIRLTLPPLRERREDVPLLVDHFLEEIAKEAGQPKKRLSDEAAAILSRHLWPGNVRELQNELRRAAVLADALIEPSHLSPKVLTGTRRFADVIPDSGVTLKAAKLTLEKRLIADAMRRSGGNIAAAARELGVHRPQLSALVKKHNLGKTLPI
jgi:Nif-specific regulatory protein